MQYWAGLYLEDDKEMMLEGVNIMLQVAKSLLARPSEESEEVRQIQDPDHQDGGSGD